MPTLIFQFPARRYHATPWGHHINEGLIEWPPSPWRLLRALLSVGYTALGWPDESPPPEARSLIEALAKALPSYHLPTAAGAHSRHYMPSAVLEQGREKTTLVFDTWAQVDEGELAVTWDVALAATELALLGELAQRLGYLGRSESWTVGRLAGPDDMPARGPDAWLPDDGRSYPSADWEQVPLLAPVAPASYAYWREKALAAALADLESSTATTGRRPSRKQRDQATALYPSDLIGCLQATTSELRRQGWSQPPGSRRVLYWRKRRALEVGMPKPRRVALAAPDVEAVLLSIATGSGNDHTLPPVTRTLPMAEELHKQVGHALKYLDLGHSRVLSGCDEQQRPLTGRHEHAHILPLDLDDDGHLDHFLIWAAMGLDADAQSAIRAVRRTFTKGGIGPLRLGLAGTGHLADFGSLPGAYGERLRDVLGGPRAAQQWISLTPFVAPRHLKARGTNSLEGQLRAELGARGLPPPSAIQIVDPRGEGTGSDRAQRHRHFIRVRRNGPSPPIDCGFTVLLEFDEDIYPKHPLTLGYGCHFGLGLFIPNRDRARMNPAPGEICPSRESTPIQGTEDHERRCDFR